MDVPGSRIRGARAPRAGARAHARRGASKIEAEAFTPSLQARGPTRDEGPDRLAVVWLQPWAALIRPGAPRYLLPARVRVCPESGRARLLPSCPGPEIPARREARPPEINPSGTDS